MSNSSSRHSWSSTTRILSRKRQRRQPSPSVSTRRIHQRNWLQWCFWSASLLFGFGYLQLIHQHHALLEKIHHQEVAIDELVLKRRRQQQGRLSSASVAFFRRDKDNSLSQDTPVTVAMAQTTDKPPFKTLALITPLTGGYRNQVLRLNALVIYAQRHNVTQLYMPSLQFQTQLESKVGFGVPWEAIRMDHLFDVNHWNMVADELGIPKLVNTLEGNAESETDGCYWWTPPDLDSDPKQQISYWKQQLRTIHGYNETAIQQISFHPLLLDSLTAGFPVAMANVTLPYMLHLFKPSRKTDYLLRVRDCTRPFLYYGSGKLAGRLWNDYVDWQARKEKLLQTKSIQQLPPWFRADQAVHQALKPKQQWREIADQCLRSHGIESGQRYLVLHARIELEMFQHRCGATMEWKLSKILDQVKELLQNQEKESVKGIMIAVSRHGMIFNSTYHGSNKKAVAQENLLTLERIAGDGSTRENGEGLTLLDGTTVPVFECGKSTLQDYYAANPQVPDHGTLLEAVVNFHLAANADVFVGVAHSSYSTEVITSRHYNSDGGTTKPKTSYRYTLDGKAERMTGLPEGHSNCRSFKLNRKIQMMRRKNG